MKRFMHSLPLLLLLATGTFLMSSCGKDGDAGPAGEKGDKGDKGDTGEKGAAVTYSDWLNVAYEADTIHTSGGGIDTVGWYGRINAPKLTKQMLTNGELKVYINLGTADDPLITPIPYSDLSGIMIQYVAYDKTIEFYSNINAGTVQRNDGKRVQQYRYVLIPGESAARKSNAVDWNNYKAVQEYLGWKD